MVNIPTRSKGALDRDSLASLNGGRTLGVMDGQSIATLNQAYSPQAVPAGTGAGRTGAAQPGIYGALAAPSRAAQGSFPAHSAQAGQGGSPAYSAPTRPVAQGGSSASISSAVMPQAMPIPVLQNPVRKGQKAPLSPGSTFGSLDKIRACFGWNTLNPACDVDVSAFLLGEDKKVLGDSWFVFYGQTLSPDGSTEFKAGGDTDREIICVDFTRLDPRVSRIVFVLTINEAFEKKLNFGMMKDAYIRILSGDVTPRQNSAAPQHDPATAGKELVSFAMQEYYSNVISMVIGEIYRYGDAWKFNAVGNGVDRDLAGLCALYGVQVEG